MGDERLLKSEMEMMAKVITAAREMRAAQISGDVRKIRDTEQRLDETIQDWDEFEFGIEMDD